MVQSLEEAGLSHLDTTDVEDWVALLFQRPTPGPKEGAR